MAATTALCVSLSAVLAAVALPPAPGIDTALLAPTAGEEADRLVHEKRYAEAADAYDRAYEETADPRYLYAQAMSLRRAGTCRAAIDVFERFLGAGPPPSDVEAARTQISECEQLLDRAAASQPVVVPESTPEPPPPVVQPEPEITDAPADRSTPRHWIRDGLGGALTGGGLLIAVTGGAVFGVAANAADVPPAETEAGHGEREREVQRTSIAAVGLLAVGGALVLGGVVRYIVVGRRNRRSALAGEGLTWRF